LDCIKIDIPYGSYQSYYLILVKSIYPFLLSKILNKVNSKIPKACKNLAS